MPRSIIEGRIEDAWHLGSKEFGGETNDDDLGEEEEQQQIGEEEQMGEV